MFCGPRVKTNGSLSNILLLKFNGVKYHSVSVICARFLYILLYLFPLLIFSNNALSNTLKVLNLFSLKSEKIFFALYSRDVDIRNIRTSAH